MEDTRICRMCGIEQPITNFHLAKSKRSGGRRYECKTCYSQAGKGRFREYYTANRDRINKQRQDLSITGTCAWCGKPFHPWKKNIGKQLLYCSRVCSSRANVSRINNGGEPATPLAPLPVRDESSVSLSADSSTTDAYAKLETLGEEWRESGEHWDKVAAWYAEREQAERKRRSQQDWAHRTLMSEGRTITLAGYGARLMVKGASLIV
jgi:hypothetical protein